MTKIGGLQRRRRERSEGKGEADSAETQDDSPVGEEKTWQTRDSHTGSEVATSPSAGRDLARNLQPGRELTELEEDDADGEGVPPAIRDLYLTLPGRSRNRSRTTWLSFVICVALPIALAVGYYGFLASNQYASEFRFTLRTQGTPDATAGAMSALAGIQSATALETNMVVDYMTSREAVAEVQSHTDLIGMYSRPDIDWWSRFNPKLPIEHFVDYWQGMITSSYDPTTGLADVEVRAFTPQDAQLIANQLVTLSEGLVNSLSDRAVKDADKFARNNVQTAEDRLRQTQAAMTAFRTKTGVIDPSSGAVSTNTELVRTLLANLVNLRTQEESLTKTLDKDSPTVVSLRQQIEATESQLSGLQNQVSKDQGTDASLTSIVNQFEQLDLERQLAQHDLETALDALNMQLATAAAQRLYITPYVQPALPQESTYPKRLEDILLTALIAFLAWASGVLIVRSIMDHSG